MWADIIDEKTKIEKMLRESLEESASDFLNVLDVINVKQFIVKFKHVHLMNQ